MSVSALRYRVVAGSDRLVKPLTKHTRRPRPGVYHRDGINGANGDVEVFGGKGNFVRESLTFAARAVQTKKDCA